MERKENPFILAFGEVPEIMLDEEARSRLIVNDIKASRPNFRNFMISGLRGSGKTVLLRSIQETLSKEKDYIFVNLDMGDGKTKNLLNQLAAILVSLPGMKALYTKAEVKVHLGNAEMLLENDNPFMDTRTEIAKMLGVLKKLNKKVVIMIDEVVDNDGFTTFASAYKELTNDYPVYLVMAGLKENTDNVINNPVNTFLRRAYPIELDGLNITLIRNEYEKILGVSRTEAEELANLTHRYSFAFQALGYAYYEYGSEKYLDEYDNFLALFVYRPLWDKLSDKDRKVLLGINKAIVSGLGKAKTSDVLESCGIQKNEFSPYRKRLSDSSIINTSEQGIISYNYPRFEVFAEKMEIL